MWIQEGPFSYAFSFGLLVDIRNNKPSYLTEQKLNYKQKA